MIQINKIMKVVKDHFFILALVAMFVGFSAFTYVERSQQTAQWYEVSAINPAQPHTKENLQIDDLFSGTPPPNDPLGCATSNPSDTCLVRLDIQDIDDPEDLLGMSIADAENEGAFVSPESGGDGYARHPEED